MGKVKIFFVVAIVLLANILAVYDQYDAYLRHVDGAFVARKNMVALILVFSALLGLLLRKEVGWILTTALLYSFLVAALSVPFKISLNVRAYAYVVVYVLVLMPILLVNNTTLLKFYKLNESPSVVRRNTIAFLISILAAVLMD